MSRLAPGTIIMDPTGLAPPWQLPEPLAQPKFNAVTKAGGQVVISWTGLGILLESTDLKTWAPVPGNPSSPYPVTPTLPQKYYRVEQ